MNVIKRLSKIALLGMVVSVVIVTTLLEVTGCFIMALGAYFYLRTYPEWLMKVMPNPWVADPIFHLTEADGYVILLSLSVFIILWGFRISLHNVRRPRW